MNYKQILFIVACWTWAINGSPTLVRNKRDSKNLELSGTAGLSTGNRSNEVDSVSFVEDIPVSRVIVLHNEDKGKTDNKVQNKVQERKTERSKEANNGEYKLSSLSKASAARSESPHFKFESHKPDVHHSTDLLGMKHRKSSNKHRSHHSDKSEKQMKFDIALDKVPLTFSLSTNEVDKAKKPLTREDIELINRRTDNQNSVEISNVVVKFGLDDSNANKYPLHLSDSLMGLNPFPHLLDRIPPIGPANFMWETRFCPVHSPYRAQEEMGEAFNENSLSKCTCGLRDISDSFNGIEDLNKDFLKNEKIINGHVNDRRGNKEDMQRKSS